LALGYTSKTNISSGGTVQEDLFTKTGKNPGRNRGENFIFRTDFAPKKSCHCFRYSARTRVIIEEKSVRIVQRMENPAARIVFTAEDAEDAEELSKNR